MLPKKTRPQSPRDSAAHAIPGVDPNDIWLSDGSLLVLKGGTTDTKEGFDNPWPPLDDYEAPYRKPVLAPTDILQKDIGKYAGIVVVPPPTQATTTRKPASAAVTSRPRTRNRLAHARPEIALTV